MGCLLGDEVISRFAPNNKAGRNWQRGATGWSYLAPPVYGVGAWYLMKDRLHERFATGTVTGTTAIAAGSTGTLTAEVTIPERSQSDFSGEHPAVATPVNSPSELAVVSTTVSSLTSGKATITIVVKNTASTGSISSPKVAWMVDLQPDSAT